MIVMLKTKIAEEKRKLWLGLYQWQFLPMADRPGAQASTE